MLKSVLLLSTVSPTSISRCWTVRSIIRYLRAASRFSSIIHLPLEHTHLGREPLLLMLFADPGKFDVIVSSVISLFAPVAELLPRPFEAVVIMAEMVVHIVDFIVFT